MKDLYRRTIRTLTLLLIITQPAAIQSWGEPNPSSDQDRGSIGVLREASTGITFERTHELAGAHDVVAGLVELCLSRDGNYLLQFMQVIPLDDREIFRLVDFGGLRNALSPDGTKVVFYAGSIWLLPISPDTGKPNGTSEKLIEGDSWWYQTPVNWCPDSSRFVFYRDRNLYLYSLRNRTEKQLTKGQDAKWPAGTCSPDGSSVLYLQSGALWQISFEEREPRKLLDIGPARLRAHFSPDGRWVFYQTGRTLTFLRLEDGIRTGIPLPEGVGTCFSLSPDGKRLLFLRPSGEWKWLLRFSAASGGKSFWPPVQEVFTPFSVASWSEDGRAVLVQGGQDGRGGFYRVPLAGKEAVPVKLDFPAGDQHVQMTLSPAANQMLVSSVSAQRKTSYWVVPISSREAHSTGPAVKLYDREARPRTFRWSPDGTSIAFQTTNALWIADCIRGGSVKIHTSNDWKTDLNWTSDGSGLTWISWNRRGDVPESTLYLKKLDGEEPQRLFTGSKIRGSHVAPQGDWIGFWEDQLEEERQALYVVDTTGNGLKKLADVPHVPFHDRDVAWSPDGKEIGTIIDQKLLALAPATGSSRIIADLSEIGWSSSYGIYWSPAGRQLAFLLYPMPGEHPPEAAHTRLFTVPAEGGKLTELGSGDRGTSYWVAWSPDGKWVAYDSETSVKVRPATEIWEASLDAFLKVAASEQ